MALKVQDYYGSSSSCPGKAKSKVEKAYEEKNFKQVCEELDDVGELLRDVLNIRSSAKNGYTLSCKRFLPQPRASDSMSTSLIMHVR